MSKIPFTLTNESITVVVGGSVKTFQKGDVKFNTLRDAVLTETWEAIPGILAPGGALAKWLASSPNPPDMALVALTVDSDGDVTLEGVKLPEVMQRRAKKMADEGGDPSGLIYFYARLSRNPSKRSVDQLWGFLEHMGISIEPAGTFLAYKGVTEDLKDRHSKTIDNSPGRVVKMDRNKISDDPREACHEGLHVGALSYASDFGPRTTIVRVDPENVVCVPYDHSAQKMRVCEYEVVGFHVDDRSERNPMPDHGEVDDTVDEPNAYGSRFSDDDDGSDDFDEVDDGEYPADQDARPAPFVKPEPKRPVLGRLDARGLLKVSLEDLRRYASKTHKIVGATKLPGGKTALVKRIVRVRRSKK